jgi:acyl-coenzyme A thioesterase PaaI-like protein
VTASATVRFAAPVRVGERVLAKATVVSVRNKRREIDVVMKTNSRLVFEGHFTIYGLSAALAERVHLFDDAELEKGGV